MSTKVKSLLELVGHRESVPATMPIDEVFRRFSERPVEFMAVLDDARCLGICSREAIGMTLGTLYGRACFAKSPIIEHLQTDALHVSMDQPLTDVLQAVSAREGARFYEDVLLTDQHGHFQGLIATQRLIQLQQSMLEENISSLELTNLQMDRHNRQMASDLQLARELQLSILPRQFPDMRHALPPHDLVVDFQYRYQPSGSVGGDFIQILPLRENRVGIFLCDVMGHGVRAALVTAMIRALLESLGPLAENPAELMGAMNRRLASMLKESDIELFATALYLVMNPGRQQLVFALAGHPPGFHLQWRNRTILTLTDPDQEAGPPIGIVQHADYANLSYAQPLAPGDTLLLFTDGLYEVFDVHGRQLGYEGLRSKIYALGMLPLGQMLDGILAKVRDFAGIQGIDDDVCILGMRWG